jgi:two-component system, LytTR family, response regulator
MIKVLVVDDESPARKRVKSLIRDESDLELVGESGDGVDALAKIKALHPDLVFLDIKLPGMSGLELSRMLQGDDSPYIIFTTAYGQYAIDAFNVDACDYLMKPFDETRFREAVEKVRSRLWSSAVTRSETAVADLIAKLRGVADVPGGASTKHFGVKDGTKIKLLDLAEVTFVRSDGDYLKIFKTDGSHSLVRERLSNLLQRINLSSFIRISRSVAVNLDYVAELKPHKRGDYEFVMKSGEHFVSGPTHRDTVRGLLARFK